LIEYGNQLLTENKYVADAIYEVLQEFHLKNDKLEKIAEAYFSMLHKNGQIDTRTFLYSSDTEMNAFVAGLLHFPYELHDWGRRMEGYSVKLDNDITNVINSALNIYKLRKIKRMYLELEDELSREKDAEKNKGFMVVYMQLKEIEKSLTSEMHTVYLK